MPKVPPAVTKTVQSVLKSEAKNGKTQVATVRRKAMARHSSSSTWGLTPSSIQTAAESLYDSEVRRLMKRHLPDTVQKMILAKLPEELSSHVEKLPSWIAIDEGPMANWVPAWSAEPLDWLANAAIKTKHARSVTLAARTPTDIGRFLETNGFRSLEEAAT